MENKLISESLKDGSDFSSHTHGIDTVAKDVNIAGIKKYFIPERYNENKIVLLPVNKTRYYFYWEFSSDFVKNNILDLKDVFFHIVDQDNNLIQTIVCTNEYGQYFFELKDRAMSIRNLQVVARYKQGSGLKDLLDSNTIRLFNNKIVFEQNDVWVNKQRGFTEVIRSSLQHYTLGMSSKNYVDEISRLNEFEKISQETLNSAFSSHNLGGKS